MPLTKQKKQEIVRELKEKLQNSGFVAFLNFHKLSVAKAVELRRALRKVGGDYAVSKKTLLVVAGKESGMEIDKNKLEGEVAVALAGKNEEAILGVAKEVATFAKKNTEMLKIIGGFWNNSWVDIEQIKRFAAIPGREVLLTQLAFILIQPVASLARVLSEVSKKGQN